MEPKSIPTQAPWASGRLRLAQQRRCPGTGVFALSYSEAIMKVALIGASGNGGSRLLAELSRRGHQVTAIARNPDTIAPLPGVTAKKVDVFDKAGLVQLLKGHEALFRRRRRR